MSVQITVTEPTATDDRYLFRVPTEDDPMSSYYPVGFARVGKDGGFDFWTGFGSQDFPLPEKGNYTSIDEIRGKMVHLITTQTPEDRAWRALSRLAGELSPENLTCDGELRGARLVAKRKRLNAEWAAQEKILGRRVTEDEVWSRIYALA